MVYKKYTAKVDIICLEHGIFSKTPYDHIKFGYECPRCNNQASKPCDDWLNSLKNSNINREYQLSNNKRIFVDGYDVTTNTIYQFHGKYWHGDYRVHDAKEYDFRRKMYFGDIYAKTLLNDFQLLCWGYNLIVMWEYDWNKFKKITRKEVI